MSAGALRAARGRPGGRVITSRASRSSCGGTERPRGARRVGRQQSRVTVIVSRRTDANNTRRRSRSWCMVRAGNYSLVGQVTALVTAGHWSGGVTIRPKIFVTVTRCRTVTSQLRSPITRHIHPAKGVVSRGECCGHVGRRQRAQQAPALVGRGRGT